MRPLVVVHGGAGNISTDGREDQVAGCKVAASRALELLRAGSSALDAVVHAVETLEDNPAFNAGTGGCLCIDGSLELDASVVDGRTRRSGAVCTLPPFKNPIHIARAVLEDGTHMLMASEGAAAFAVRKGFARVAPEAMITDRARARLEAFRIGRSAPVGGGTVGAVAIDRDGNVASATSTGGMVGKERGRVGDSPIQGAGGDADNDAGACSATGHGEAIMRACLSRVALDHMRAGQSATDAARAAIHLLESRYGGHGGIITVDRSGGPGWAFNTQGMSYAVARDGDALTSGS